MKCLPSSLKLIKDKSDQIYEYPKRLRVHTHVSGRYRDISFLVEKSLKGEILASGMKCLWLVTGLVRCSWGPYKLVVDGNPRCFLRSKNEARNPCTDWMEQGFIARDRRYFRSVIQISYSRVMRRRGRWITKEWASFCSSLMYLLGLALY